MFNQKTIAVVILSIWFLAIAGFAFAQEAADTQGAGRGYGRGQGMGRQGQGQPPVAPQPAPAPEVKRDGDRPLPPPQGQFDRSARQEQFRRGMAPQAGRPDKGMKKQFKRGGQMGNHGRNKMSSPRGGQHGWGMAGRPMPFAGQQGFGGRGQMFGAGRGFPQWQPQGPQQFQRPMQNQPFPMRPQMNPGFGRQGQQQGMGMAGRPMPFAGGQGFAGRGQGFNFQQLSPQARQQLRNRFEQLPPEKRQQIRQRLEQRFDGPAAPMSPRMRHQFGNPRQGFAPRDNFWAN